MKLDRAEGVRFTFYLDPEEPWHSSMSHPSRPVAAAPVTHGGPPDSSVANGLSLPETERLSEALPVPCAHLHFTPPFRDLTIQELGGPQDECQPRSHPVQFHRLKSVRKSNTFLGLL